MNISIKAAYRSTLAILPLRIRRQLFFLRAHGRFYSTRNPVTFSEKVQWRIMNDRRHIFLWTCDKLAMKSTVRDMHDSIVPVPTLWSGNNVQELQSFRFPERWVLKPNHLSGGRIFIGEGTPNFSELQTLQADWARETDVSTYLGEWAYTQARPLALLEPWIGGALRTDTPTDYKFFVFHGRVKLIQVHSSRIEDHRIYHFSPDWTPLGVSTSLDSPDTIAAPSSLPAMIHQAEIIGADFDFIRVDLYSTDQGIFFGEVTPYPASGLRKFEPYSFDVDLGSLWTLPTGLEAGQCDR